MGLVACATTTSPLSGQADPTFARKVVTYSSSVPPGTIVIDPAITFSIWYRAADKQSAMGSASAGKALDGRARLAFTPNRNHFFSQAAKASAKARSPGVPFSIARIARPPLV